MLRKVPWFQVVGLSIGSTRTVEQRNLVDCYIVVVVAAAAADNKAAGGWLLLWPV